MSAFEIRHLGGEHGVTGSCHLLMANGLNILVDCGLAQGRDTVLPMTAWPVKPSQVDFLFLTHAHIDHIGRVPELLQKGFSGEIITTHPTRELLAPMLSDAAGFSGMDEGESEKLLHSIDRLCWGFEYGKAFDLKRGVRFKLGCAGHILGSCFIRFESSSPDWSVIFSGDLGAKDTPILPDPDPPDACDLLVLESTYGDRLHEDRKERVERLGKILTRALSDGGKVFIPAFALGRTQELLYEMDRLGSDPRLRALFPKLGPRSGIPVCLDSPLALELTKIYSRLQPFWDREANEILRSGDDPLDFEHLYGVGRFRDHLELIEMPGPAVILAGSGMCTGGRIVNHLKAGLGDARNDVLFVGYQAAGTAGRDIVRYADKPGGYANLDGERVGIRAKVHVLAGYSAHADQRGLVEWVRAMPEKPGRIKLVHGEEAARRALAEKLEC